MAQPFTPYRYEDRRASLDLAFQPRARRSIKIWKDTFAYYRKHAGRVWNSEDLRPRVKEQIGAARVAIFEAMGRLKQAMGPAGDVFWSAYDECAIVDTIEVDARYPEIVEYLELFRAADRIFALIDIAAARQLMEPVMVSRTGADVGRALRCAAQVVSQTPGRNHDASLMGQAAVA